MKCIIQVVGPSNSGKTSAIVLALRRLREAGISATVIKHTHHDVDTPQKDSWRFINEGSAEAAVVVKGSGESVSIFMRDLSLERVIQLAPTDLIIVEGFKDLELGEMVEVSGSVEETAEIILTRAIRCLRSREAI